MKKVKQNRFLLNLFIIFLILFFVEMTFAVNICQGITKIEIKDKALIVHTTDGVPVTRWLTESEYINCLKSKKYMYMIAYDVAFDSDCNMPKKYPKNEDPNL